IMGEAAFNTILPSVGRVLNGERVETEAEIDYQHTGKRVVHVVSTPERDENAALYEFTNRLYRAESLSVVYEAALDAIIRALGCERASIVRTDPQRIM